MPHNIWTQGVHIAAVSQAQFNILAIPAVNGRQSHNIRTVIASHPDNESDDIRTLNPEHPDNRRAQSGQSPASRILGYTCCISTSIKKYLFVNKEWDSRP